jgi:indole-3-glycerol phosphate synthase
VSTILDTIVARKREEVRALGDPRELARRASEMPPTRGFAAALRRAAGQPVRAIAEIKRASPSAGPIRPGADPAAIAREYAAAGASALSVLTDREFFDGELGFLARVRDAVALPLLRKDFLISGSQIDEARIAGADAVLLIAAILPDKVSWEQDDLPEMIAAARALGMDALVEVHDEREAERAIAAGAEIIGVNHRNLATLAIDMTLTARIAPMVPAGTILVGESGIKTAADVRALAAAGAHAILVGETLMRAASPGAALAELLS